MLLHSLRELLASLKASLPSFLYLYLYAYRYPFLSPSEGDDRIMLKPFSLSHTDIGLKPGSRVLTLCPGGSLNTLIQNPSISATYDYVISNSRAFYLKCVVPDLIVYEVSDVSGDFGLHSLRHKLLEYPQCKALILLGSTTSQVSSSVVDDLNVQFADSSLDRRVFYSFCYVAPAPQKRIAREFLRRTKAESFPSAIVPHFRSSSSVPILISFFREASSISLLGLDGAGDYVFSNLDPSALEPFCRHPHMDEIGLLPSDVSPDFYRRLSSLRLTAAEAHSTNDPRFGSFTMYDFLALMREFVQLELVEIGTAFDSLFFPDFDL